MTVMARKHPASQTELNLIYILCSEQIPQVLQGYVYMDMWGEKKVFRGMSESTNRLRMVLRFFASIDSPFPLKSANCSHMRVIPSPFATSLPLCISLARSFAILRNCFHLYIAEQYDTLRLREEFLQSPKRIDQVIYVAVFLLKPIMNIRMTRSIPE